MKKALFAALTLISVWANPAEATPQLRNLFTAVQATGTSIVLDDPRICKDPQLMGMYSYRKDVIDQLTICVANHRGDNAGLYDTILHESVHVAQACKGGPLYSLSSLLKSSPDNEIDFVNSRYTGEQLHRELEARVIARDQDEVYVTNLIKEECK
jgi:hypothetical protein